MLTLLIGGWLAIMASLVVANVLISIGESVANAIPSRTPPSTCSHEWWSEYDDNPYRFTEKCRRCYRTRVSY